MRLLHYKNEFIGEVLGTFVLILFGCGANAVSTLFDVKLSLMDVALSWGVGVTLAIYLTRHISFAHLNPAVSIAMIISGRMSVKRLPNYVAGQLLGAFLAALSLYLIFGQNIATYEHANDILRGSVESVKTARMFGPYYTLADGLTTLPLPHAFGIEVFGTFLLLLLVFALTEDCNVGRPDVAIAPLFVGLTVTSIICLIGPMTMAGLNPARDLGPRLVTVLFAWGEAAFTPHRGGFLIVYTLAPIVGASLAAFFFTKVLEPIMVKSRGEL